MDLRELRYFLALVEERNFTRAAARCYVTQPAFSRAIRKLEREMGGPLVERTPRECVPTERGLRLATVAGGLVENADRLVDAVRRPQPRRGVGRLGVCCGAGADLLPELAPAFARAAPGATLEVRSVDTVEQLEGLRAGRLDACLSVLPFDPNGLERTVLRVQPRSALLSVRDPMAAAGSLTVAEVREKAFLPADPREPAGWDGFFSVTEARDGDEGRRRRVDFDPAVEGQMAQIATSGGATLVLPEFIGRAFSAPSWGLTLVPVRDAQWCPITFATCPVPPEHPVAVLRDLAVQLAAAQDGLARLGDSLPLPGPAPAAPLAR
jgi:DNA-binding transcriptional LysR family regulator